MANSAASNRSVVEAYRKLYKTGLRAVRYSKPSRYILRDRLRKSFRHPSATQLDPVRIRNTVEFLRLAAVAPSVESRLLQSLLRTWYYDARLYPRRQPQAQLFKRVSADETEFRATAREPFEQTVRLLNESMGMCIPI